MSELPPVPAPSYRALLAVPSLGRALSGMQVARIAQSMVGVATVLFALGQYRSSELAGLITFVSIFPGLLVSPIAGALLDRHGRTRLIALDFVVGMAAMTLIGVLALLDRLPLPLLIGVAGVASLTGPLSGTGLRSLFPLMVPERLWERLNAVDSNGWVVASIVGPPIAAGLVGLVGGPVALIVVGLLFGLAALIVSGVPEPAANPIASSGRILRDAWDGLRYTWSNPTLRGLGIAMSILNIGNGLTVIVIPLIVIERLGYPEAVVGLVFALEGVAGMIAGTWAGRLDTRRSAKRIMVTLMFLIGPATAILLLPGGLPVVAVALFLLGLATGPYDVAMFTMRQRRTDPAWMGRAFAISMSLNFSGYPIGAAIGGVLGGRSIEAAIVLGVIAPAVAGLIAWRLIPAHDPRD